MATNFYVIGNSAPVPNLTGTPYAGYKVVTASQISSPNSSSTNLMHDGDKIVISGSVDSNVTLQPGNGLSNGFDLKVEILDNTHTFNISAGNRSGGTINSTEPDVTVDVVGKAPNVSVGGNNHMETLTVNLADNTAIGDITGSTEADDALIIRGGDNVRIGNITSHSGAVKSDSVILGDKAQVGNVVLGGGDDTFQIGGGGTTGTIDTGTGNDQITLGHNAFTMDIATGKGHDVVEIGADSRTLNISGGDNMDDTMKLTVGDRSTIGNVHAGTTGIFGQYGGNDTIAIGNNVTAGTIKTEAGNDQITIGTNSHTGDISSGDGADTVTTGSGTTTGALNTGAGNDTITIGGTTTNIDVGGGATNLHVTATGTTGDLKFGGENDTVVVDGKAGYIQGSGGDDTITVNGRSGTIEGNSGDDVINVNGTAGDIYGGTGSDKIVLGDGATVGAVDFGSGSGTGDTLLGGNDVLIGGGIHQNTGDYYSITDLGDRATIAGDVYVHGGKDTLSVGEGSSIGGYVIMGSDGSGDDADVLHIGAGSVVEGYIHTNQGNDTVIIGDRTTLNGDVTPQNPYGYAINTEMGEDILHLGDGIVTRPGHQIFTGQGWDTVIAAGGGSYSSDMGKVAPDGDRVTINYHNQDGRAALEKALADQGWVRGADGIYTHHDSSNATFVWEGVTYLQVWQVNGVPCFGKGTLIRTDRGDIAIEHLAVGDLVLTADNGLRPIRWIGGRILSRATLDAQENLRPIRIRRGALGQGVPSSDLIVSPQHRILVRSRIAQKMFGTDEVLVAAKQLCQIKGIDVAYDMAEVEYFHMLFDQHEVVVSNGAPTESLYPGPEALKSVGDAAREEIFTIFPELRCHDYQPTPARQLASGRMARKLAVRHAQNSKPLMM